MNDFCNIKDIVINLYGQYRINYWFFSPVSSSTNH